MQEEFGLGDLQSFKAASVLAGGVAYQGETCGALLGALMAVGLAVGRESISDTDQYRKAMEPAQEVRRRFMERIQAEYESSAPLESTLCRDIQARVYGRSFEMSDPEDRQRFLDAGGHSARGCPRVSGLGAEAVAELLLEWEGDGEASSAAQ